MITSFIVHDPDGLSSAQASKLHRIAFNEEPVLAVFHPGRVGIPVAVGEK